jgi:ribulose-phosphate 3-epimerase
MVHISASLLAADYARLGEEVRRAQAAGVDSFHFDMMDGHYVSNFALTPDHLTALRAYSNLPFHAHLELDNPDKVLESFVCLDADLIVVQWDTLIDPIQTFRRIRSRFRKVGLALNPNHEVADIGDLIQELDLLLILGVYPGFGGQPMADNTLEKISQAHRSATSYQRKIAIAVDGGVNPQNAHNLISAGADCLIMGTALFGSPDMPEIVRIIRESSAK